MTNMVVKSTRWPEDLLAKMEAEADEAGMSFSDYVRAPFEDDPVCADCGHQTVLEGGEGPEADPPTPSEPQTPVEPSSDPVVEPPNDPAPEFASNSDSGEEDFGKIATIVGHGSLSVSEDEATQADVLRVKELLDEGAVGVSVKLDLNPDEMPDPELIKQLQEEDKWDELQELMEKVHYRIRHLAIVDTAAFSDAHLVLGEDGFSVSGPMVFEGPWTGDERIIPFGKLDIEGTPFPISIIWDRHEGDHTGVVVGHIDSAERIEEDQRAVAAAAHIFGQVSDGQVEAVSAAAGTKGTIPARYVKKFKSTKNPLPMKVEAPDENGLRHIWGVAAPKGVCHRSDMGACFQFPGDIDKEHRGFHTGALVTLDDGTEVRMGALTFGGMHVDNALAKQGVSWREQNRHREDAHKVLAMVRAWEDQYGHLCVSGVVPPDVTQADLLRALACAPSAELWPRGRGRTLVGLHMVPTPAWPVAASMGPDDDGLLMTGTSSLVVEDAQQMTALVPNHVVAEGSGTTIDLSADFTEMFEGKPISTFDERLDRIEKALALLVSDKVADGIPDPDAVE